MVRILLAIALLAALLAAILNTAVGHSVLTDPTSFSPRECRIGGESPAPVLNCPGPCNLEAIRDGYARNASPSDPAAVWKRGELVKIKYQRNNHGPGGFYRLTLVPQKDMMNKAIHNRNAFYYACWGATPVAARNDELGYAPDGYSFVATDGDMHDFTHGYYEAQVRVPDVVPDGVYVLGHVWFGGTGSQITTNIGQQKPGQYGFFADYWSCSYVEVKGGVPLQSQYTPVFNNDMPQYSADGCMSANDSPGVCSKEPCRGVAGQYQKPLVFKRGNPPALIPSYFGG